jgi:hypothetical protein
MTEAKKQVFDNDPVAEKREERSLRNFKQVLREIVYLLMQSTRSETASLYWVNKQRGQFVLESYSSRIPTVTFQDRVDFDQSFLSGFETLQEPVQLEVGVHVQPEQLTHYFNGVTVRFVNLIPFINKGETIAITVLESNAAEVTSEDEESVSAYSKALENLLFTFLELSDLSKDESQWSQYDDMLEQINSNDDHALLLDSVMMQLQSFLSKGGVSLLCRGNENWRVVLNSTYAYAAPLIGTVLLENTIGYEALRTGKPAFTIHFNSNPRRVSVREPMSQGATLAIPMLLHDRRQAVFVVNDENPLLFTESVKHKMTNLVRIAGLKMMASKESYRVASDFMTHDYGAFLAPLIERGVHRQIKRAKLFPERHTWVAMFTFNEINQLRTRYGIDTLRSLQKQVISCAMIDSAQVSGIVGFHADYIYTAIIQSTDSDGIVHWQTHLQEQQKESFQCEKDAVKLTFRVGFSKVGERFKDTYDLLKSVKIAFSDASRQDKFMIEI